MLTLLEEKTEKNFSTQDMKIGQIAKIDDGTIIMKMYDGFVSLTDPKVTWDEILDVSAEPLQNGTMFIVNDNV